MELGDDYSVKKHRSGVKVVFNCLLIAFYALFLVLEAGGGLRNVPLKSGPSQNLHANFISPSHQSNHRPFRARQAAVVSEVKDVSESENDFHSEFGKLSHTLPTEIALELHSGKSLFLQLRHVNESLARISLVVLHHCWKSYLR